MRKTISLFLAATLLLTLSIIPINAAGNNTSVIYFEDGSYITIEISEVVTRASTVSNTKTYTYHNTFGVEEWKAVLRGSFLYTGTSVTCTSSECDVTISNSSWSVSSKTTSRTVDTAIADVTMVSKVLGITIKTETIRLALTCSPTGVLS